MKDIFNTKSLKSASAALSVLLMLFIIGHTMIADKINTLRGQELLKLREVVNNGLTYQKGVVDSKQESLKTLDHIRYTVDRNNECSTDTSLVNLLTRSRAYLISDVYCAKEALNKRSELIDEVKQIRKSYHFFNLLYIWTTACTIIVSAAIAIIWVVLIYRKRIDR